MVSCGRDLGKSQDSRILQLAGTFETIQSNPFIFLTRGLKPKEGRVLLS